ncbi:hypothetical protein DSO57_1018012 [Entomophthora muscae]|uniref:Uncharacterized protein n=1 Tax=Entomophthora muscae TaxID=34485 RepID=A0ACC2TFC3_9FUNG|nr:hypothetical protein DSO57_1018012 [Entomophthora muscae]
MSAHNNSQPSLRQVYQDLMSGMTDEDCKAFMQMLCSSQLRVQDCDTTVAGSERGTATHVEGKEEVDSIFVETEAPLIQLPCFGFENLQDWSYNIILKTASCPLTMPSALLCACCNSKELPSAYSAIINQFGVSHPKEMLYMYVQALFAKDNTMTPICLGACYHGSYNM